MIDRQARNNEWEVVDVNNQIHTWERVSIAVLMDIRRELQRLNMLLHCPNFLNIPSKLERICSNTTRPKRRKVKS